MEFRYGDVVRALLGNTPNPYMGLDIPNGLRNTAGLIGRRWDDFAQRYLPQPPGMQKELFPQYDENDPVTYELMKKVYNIQ